MKRVLYIGLLLLVGLLTLEGCIKEDNPVVAETRNISMTMNVDTRAGGSDINVDIESAINTLRVYAFYGERKVGYFYGNDKNLVVDGGKLSFSMDLDIPTMSFLEEPISFYLVANEETVSVYNSPAWSPDMTRMQLENYCFRELNNPRTALPMVTVKDVMINPNDIKESEVHSEHWMWTGGPIEFELERSVAKLGMYFAAKEPDADLEVMQVEILPSGLQDYSYMFAPGHESENLKNVPHSWQYGFSLINGGAVSIDKVVTDDEYNSYTPEDKKNPEKISAAFTDVLSAPTYMFENYYGSNNPNQQGANDTDGKGYVLKVTYSVAGSQSEKLIYLPDVERNACYYVLNRIGVDGIVSIVYNVADWENGGDYTVEWWHPTHSFTASASEVGDDYCKINYDIDHTGEDAVNGEGATFLFNMSAPVGQIWVVSIDNAQDFTLWVDGKKASEGESGDTTTADGKDHILKVTAKNPNTIEERVTRLTIKSVMWGEANSNLLINQDLDFPGGGDFITITQNALN